MKKILVAATAVALITTTAAAQARGNDWVAPALIGGIVGYAIAQPRPVVVQQPIYQPVYASPQYLCTPVYQMQQQLDPYGRLYLVPVQVGCN